mmetsp:Transcript_31521/g.101215  ORF Transcript_31521/g.101215 Transcript_31521/m.101215 type:complete len:189 (+) Transcript_31521:552-1118(+)
MASHFGVVIPGRPVLVEFEMIESTKSVATIVNPGEINEMCFFLLPGVVLPPNASAVLYYTVDGVGWTALGAISPEKPSGIFRTPWHAHVEGAVQLGVSLESNETVANLNLSRSGVDDRRAFGQKIAQDLFNFLASFAHPTNDARAMLAGANLGEVLVVPANVIDRWITRFHEKYQRDPNFYLKDSFNS